MAAPRRRLREAAASACLSHHGPLRRHLPGGMPAVLPSREVVAATVDSPPGLWPGRAPLRGTPDKSAQRSWPRPAGPAPLCDQGLMAKTTGAADAGGQRRQGHRPPDAARSAPGPGGSSASRPGPAPLQQLGTANSMSIAVIRPASACNNAPLKPPRFGGRLNQRSWRPPVAPRVGPRPYLPGAPSAHRRTNDLNQSRVTRPSAGR